MVENGGSMDIYVQTFYINKKGSIARLDDAQGSKQTPETTSGTASENNNITNERESQDFKTSREFSRDIAKYTEKQYNDFGWARANNVLSVQENEEWKNLLQNKNVFPKSFSGARIIPVGKRFGIGNVLVYTKGGYINPVIEKVVRINVDVDADYDIETYLGRIREDIYDQEEDTGSAIEIVRSYSPKGLIGEHTLKDWATYSEYLNGWGGGRYGGPLIDDGRYDAREVVKQRTGQDGERIKGSENKNETEAGSESSRFFDASEKHSSDFE